MTRPLRSLVSDSLRERMTQLAGLQDATRSEAELVHEIRVASKQFRALLQFVRGSAGERFCEAQDRRLADAARSLAADRDLLVVRETLELLARKCDRFSGRDSLHRLLLHLGEQRAGQGVPAATLRHALTVLTDAATAMRRRLQRGPANAGLIKAFRREYRQARRLTAKSRRKPGKAAWHHWRRQVKALHYQAASLQPVRPGSHGRLARRCWKLQGLLGCHHDLHLTRERLCRLRIDPINEPCRKRALHVVDGEIARLERKILRRTKSFLAKPSKTFVARLQEVSAG